MVCLPSSDEALGTDSPVLKRKALSGNSSCPLETISPPSPDSREMAWNQQTCTYALHPPHPGTLAYPA